MKYSRFIILIPTLLFLLNCHKDKPSHIFLITLDTTRADSIDYVQGNKRTPNLASLSSEGTNFSNAYSTIPITLPSHASMFYSLYPHDLKLYNNGQVNKSRLPSFTQLMKKNGFRTAAVISLGVLKKDFGLGRGFDNYIENFAPSIWTKSAEEVNRDLFPLIRDMKDQRSFIWAHYSDPHEPYFPPYFDGKFEIRSENTIIYSISNNLYPLVKQSIELKPGRTKIKFISKIASQIESDPGYIINGVTYSDLKFDPEDTDRIKIIYPDNWQLKGGKGNDYFSTELESDLIIINNSGKPAKADLSFLYTLNEDNKSKRKLYLESVKYLDHQIGKLISFLKEEKILRRSVILIVGDHGEGFGEYLDNYGHIHYLNKIYSHIPFIIYGKGIKKGEIRDDLTSNLNIAPTILEIAGIKKPEFMLGTSVISSRSNNKLILETFSPEAYFDAFSVIEYPAQIIFYPGRRENRTEYIDLENDPAGTIIDNKNISGQLRKKLLKSVLGISRSITATKGKIGKRKRIHKDILKSLGYL
ncbi:MAG: sulfatase [Acidobacteriota bacterium]